MKNEDLIRLLKKMIPSINFEEKGYNFQFEDIRIKDGYPTFYVNVITSKPNQSYVKHYLFTSVQEKIMSLSNYFGNKETTPFGGIVIQMLVNGKKPLDVFISKELKDKIINFCNSLESISDFHFVNSPEDDEIELTGKSIFSIPKNEIFYKIRDKEDLLFTIDTQIYNLKVNGKKVKIENDYDFEDYVSMFEDYSETNGYEEYISDRIWSLIVEETGFDYFAVYAYFDVSVINGFSK